MTTETRNHYLEDILEDEGGTPTPNMDMNELLSAIVVAAGGTVTDAHNQIDLLNDYLEAKGGSRVDVTRNKVIEAILTQLSASFPDDETRNVLLSIWNSALIANVVTYDLGVMTYQGDGNPVIYPP